MKWKDADFNTGIESVRAVLIYGPDAGQVDEYCDLAIEKLEIEADENTGITFNNRYNWNTEKQKLELDDSRAIHTIVGPTEKYILQVENTDTDNELDYIFNCEFDQPAYSIINYNAVVSLEIKGNPMNQ